MPERAWILHERPKTESLRPAVFLDRDGVINAMHLDPEHGHIDSPANPGQFRLLPGAAEGIARLRSAGFLAVVVSNQPGIAKGKLTPALLDAITAKLTDELVEVGAELDGIYYCLHHPMALLPEYRADCTCRKPLPGLLQRAASEMGIDLAASYMVGDGLTDMQAGRAAGCRTVWVGDWKCDICSAARAHDALPDLVAPSLLAAANVILQEAAIAGQ